MNDFQQILAQLAQWEKENKWSESIKLLEEWIAKNPKHAESRFRLALLYQQTGNLLKAVDAFEELARLTPNDAVVYQNLGVLNYQQNLWEKAESAFRKAVQLDSNYAEAWYGLGKVLLKQNRPEEAAAAFQASLRWNPDFKQAKKALQAIPLKHRPSMKKRMRIGFVTIWFERGQAYVTKILRDALKDDHETFVLARTGGVYGEPKLEKKGVWDVPNLTTYPEYQIPGAVVKQWIDDNQLDLVIFNEEYDWALVMAAKETGVKVITYLDYYKEDWKPYMAMYDGVICSTMRTFQLVRSFCSAHYVGWAVDTVLFHPPEEIPPYTFFHNAGWLGINYRKMTPAAVVAFDAISKSIPEITLFIHSQAGLDKMPATIVNIIKENPRITYHIETVPAPGLYHKGKILLFPTKLEGLGLPLSEALACGMPVIATNAPPMNEFIRHGQNGLLVNVARTETRHDNIAFPETLVNLNHLAEQMAVLARDPNLTREMGIRARKMAEEELSYSGLREKMEHVLIALFKSSDQRK